MPCGEEENIDVWEIEKGARKSLAVEQPWEKTRFTPATKTLPASKINNAYLMHALAYEIEIGKLHFGEGVVDDRPSHWI